MKVSLHNEDGSSCLKQTKALGTKDFGTVLLQHIPTRLPARINKYIRISNY